MTLRRPGVLRRRSVGLLLPLLLVVPAAPALAQDDGADQHSGTADQHSGTGDQHSGGETDQGPHDSPTTTAAPTTTTPEAPVPQGEPDPPDEGDEPPTTPATSTPTTVPDDTVPEPTTPTTAPDGQAPEATVPLDPPVPTLPLTGGDVRGLAAIGLGIATAGAALVLVGRRGDDHGAEA